MKRKQNKKKCFSKTYCLEETRFKVHSQNCGKCAKESTVKCAERLWLHLSANLLRCAFLRRIVSDKKKMTVHSNIVENV